MFARLSGLFANMARSGGDGLSQYVDGAAFDAAVRKFCDRLIDGAVLRHNPSALAFVEKTPRHALMLHRVQHVYPDVHVVHIVRDGRDVARSLAEFSLGVPNP